MINYSTRTAVAALGIEEKALDNVLSREATKPHQGGVQGLSRRLTFDSLLELAIAFILKRELGVPISRGLELATEIACDPNGTASLGAIGTLRLDTTSLRNTLSSSLAVALEDTSTPRRGRPPTQTAATNEGRDAS
jgi:hypothetical protein